MGKETDIFRFRTRSVVATTAALIVIALGTAGAGSARQARGLGTCTPSAWTNAYSGDAQAVGVANCQAGAPCYYFDVRLVTSSGTVLKEWLSTYATHCPPSGSESFPTARTYCQHQYVHSFFYMNLAGTGKSYTTGNVSCG